MPDSISIQLPQLWQQAKQQLLMPRLIASAKIQRVMALAAREYNVEITLEELQAAADALRIQHGLLTTDKTLAWLEQHGLSVEDFEDIAQAHCLADHLKQQVVEAEIAAYFYRHQLDYEEAILYQLSLPKPELAMELFYASQEGEVDFLALLHQYVSDRQIRRDGGYRRVVRRQDLSAELSSQVFAAAAPVLLRPMVVNQQVQLIFVVELLKPELDDALQAQIREVLFERWLQDQLERYVFDYPAFDYPALDGSAFDGPVQGSVPADDPTPSEGAE
jgi:hypothetical protein